MEPKSGAKTTEFWTAVLGGLAAVVPTVLSALSGRPWVAAVLAVAGHLHLGSGRAEGRTGAADPDCPRCLGAAARKGPGRGRDRRQVTARPDRR